MPSTPPPAESCRSARDWIKILNGYRKPNAGQGVFELAATIVPFVLLWLLAWVALSFSFWLTLALAIPASGFLVRLFLIQHDCGHGSFFRRQATNNWIGRIIGVVTLTPYDVWRRSHAIHHATTGNLDLRGMGDFHTLTVDEYQALSRYDRLIYRLYRHPLIFLGLGPSYVFLLQNRLPLGFMTAGWSYWLSAILTNVGIVGFAAIMILSVGFTPFIAVHLPIVILASTIGVWLFYIQHQFEDAHWERQADWNVHDAGLQGSSYYQLPLILQWLTANIGMHHVHHLCSRIPFYRLPEVVRDHPEISADVKCITLLESLQYARLQLWDERQKKLVSLKSLHQE
ncbi:MAG: fatty acid desaturase [Pseudomonadota bacterium]